MRYSCLLLLGAACLGACSSTEPAPGSASPSPSAPAKRSKARAKRPLAKAKSPAPKPPAEAKGIRINVVVEGVDLADVMDAIGERVGRNILVDPKIDETVTASYKELPWREAVDRIAKSAGCEVEERSGGVLLLTQPIRVTLTASKAPLGLVIDRLARTAGYEVKVPDAIRARPVTLRAKDAHWRDVVEAQLKRLTPPLTLSPDGADAFRLLTPAAAQKAEEAFAREEEARIARAGKAIDVDVERQDLAQVLQQIGAKVGHKLRVGPGVKETVSVSLSGLPWREAVDVIARMHRCEVEEDEAGVLTLTQPTVVGIVAREAPAQALLRLLASYDRTLTLRTAGLEGRTVSYEAESTNWLRTIRAVAKQAGGRVTETAEGKVSIRAAGPPPRPAATSFAAPAPPRRPAPPSAARKAALRAEVDALFQRLEAHATAREVKELIGVTGEVRELMELEGADAVQAVQAGLDRRKQRLAAMGPDLALALQLQVDLQVGNALLREFSRSAKAERYDDFPELLERLRAFTTRLYRQDHDVFRRTAAAIQARGTGIAERVAELKRLANFAREVSATVVLPNQSKERSGAIVDGRAYRAGETLRDAQGAPIAGLVLEEVGGGHVALSYRGTWFSRVVKRAPPRALPSGEGVVILHNGAVFVGTPMPSPNETVTHAWSHGTQTWSRGARPQQIRWSSARGDRPTKDYWTQFADVDRFPIDARYLPLLEDHEEEKRLREAFVDVPPKEGEEEKD